METTSENFMPPTKAQGSPDPTKAKGSPDPTKAKGSPDPVWLRTETPSENPTPLTKAKGSPDPVRLRTETPSENPTPPTKAKGSPDPVRLRAETPSENFMEAHEPHWVSRSAFQIVVIFFFITEIALAIVLHSGVSLWFAVPLVLVASHFMHGAAVGFHEATHGLLRRNRRFNEFDGVLLGVFSFLSFSLYRAAHQLHHMHLATERDEELWPFVHPDMPRWARILAAVIELTFGLAFLPFLFMRIFLRAGSPIRSKKVRRRIWQEVALTVVVWTAIIAAVAHWDAWLYLLWMYVLPAWLAANLQSWRKYIEHVGLEGNTANSSTRSIVARGWMGRFVAFTLLHEPYHGLHHMHAGLPHAELPRLAAELQPRAPEERPPFPSYTHALVDLFRSLADPRVGAQWRKPPSVST